MEHRARTNKLLVGVAFGAMLFALSSSAGAQQQPKKVPRIGYLSGASASFMQARTDGFRRGLRELGYVEGKSIIVEWRYADGKLEHLPELAAELVGLKLDVIVSAGGSVTAPVKEATSTIPIVFSQDADPVGNGFVVSLARPGGNITGLSNLSSDLVGKRLELLKEIVPKLSRVAILGTSSNRDNAREVKSIENTAAAFGVKTQYIDVLSHKAIETAFLTASKSRTDAVQWLVAGPFATNLKEIAEQAVKYRLPVMYTRSVYVEAGGLMNYGVNLPDLDRRAATYVHKIVNGARPADLPVEQSTKFEFIINLKTAKQIGLMIPPNVLARADRVIK